MTGLTFNKAASYSLILHIFILIFAMIASMLKDRIAPKFYTVNLVDSAILERAKPEPKTNQSQQYTEDARGSAESTIRAGQTRGLDFKKTTDTKDKVKSVPVKVVPLPRRPASEDKAQTYLNADPVQEPEDGTPRQSLDQYISEKMKEIKLRKQNERYKGEKISLIESNIRLKQIKQRALVAGDEAEKKGILDEYSALITNTIRRAWVFPAIELKGLQATILVSILEDGTLTIRKIDRSSGNVLFDRSVLKAIQKASPVEPPPFGEKLDDVTLHFRPDEQ